MQQDLYVFILKKFIANCEKRISVSIVYCSFIMNKNVCARRYIQRQTNFFYIGFFETSAIRKKITFDILSFKFWKYQFDVKLMMALKRIIKSL